MGEGNALEGLIQQLRHTQDPTPDFSTSLSPLIRLTTAKRCVKQTCTPQAAQEFCMGSVR